MEILRYSNLKFITDYGSQSIDQGSIVCIVGKSGSGKSSLLKLINNSLNMKEGHIYYRNKDIMEIDPTELRSNIILSGQDSYLFDGSIRDNFDKFYTLKDMDIPDDNTIEKFLDIVCLNFSINHRVDLFSGGEKQRLFLAIAISFMPEILLLDEPTSALDYKTSRFLMDKLVKFSKKNKMSLIIVSHDLDLVEEYADKIIRI